MPSFTFSTTNKEMDKKQQCVFLSKIKRKNRNTKLTLSNSSVVGIKVIKRRGMDLMMC